VTLCCIDFDGKTVVGNAQDRTLRDILSSDTVGAIMDGFRSCRLVHPYCKHCLGSSSLVSWALKPLASVAGLKLLKPFFYRKTRLARSSG